ncbi:MAG TPA: VWA domain-containing protein, partial [Candidatus Hydrogenedentes bacterium]|nr:VWA domain-containing protein [Candidatus Hydrogenedentota bacterium]
MNFLSAITGFFSGTFLTPLFFWFLWLIPVVILLYLLKLRRTEVVISSTMLWRKSLQDLTANAPFQRLRKNLLLFLQILILLALVAALARPFMRAEGAAGANICLLVDCSASMQTLEGETTRLDLAKEKALALVNEMKRGDKAMVVTFGHGATVACELSDDRVRLRRAIRAIEAGDTRTSIRDALLVAHSLKLQNADLRLVILSDGNIADIKELGTRVPDATFVSFSQVGESTNNAGIVGFSLRKPQEGQGEQQTFALVHNAHTEPLETTLSLLEEGRKVNERRLVLPRGESQVAIATIPETEGTREFRLVLPLFDDEVNTENNEARVSVKVVKRTLRVLLIAGNPGREYFYLV